MYIYEDWLQVGELPLGFSSLPPGIQGVGLAAKRLGLWGTGFHGSGFLVGFGRWGLGIWCEYNGLSYEKQCSLTVPFCLYQGS